MPNIGEIKKQEMEDIQQFCEHIREYGHIFYGNSDELAEPFSKIMEGIKEVNMIIKNYFSY